MRQLTRTDKAVFVLSALGLCIYAGTKHPSDTGGGGIGGDGGSTNAPPALMAMRPRLAAPPPSILVPDGDFDFNTQFHSPGFLSLTFERNEQ